MISIYLLLLTQHTHTQTFIYVYLSTCINEIDAILLCNANTCIVVSFYCTLGYCFCHRGWNKKKFRQDHSVRIVLFVALLCLCMHGIYVCVLCYGHVFVWIAFVNYRKYFLFHYSKNVCTNVSKRLKKLKCSSIFIPSGFAECWWCFILCWLRRTKTCYGDGSFHSDNKLNWH